MLKLSFIIIKPLEVELAMDQQLVVPAKAELPLIPDHFDEIERVAIQQHCCDHPVDLQMLNFLGKYNRLMTCIPLLNDKTSLKFEFTFQPLHK